jgi:hypothetical protein
MSRVNGRFRSRRGFHLDFPRSPVHGNADFPMANTPIHSGSSTPVPQMDDSDLVGKSRIAIPLCTSCTTPEIPIPRTPTLRDPLPCVPAVGRLRSFREIAYRGFVMYESFVPETPISRSPTLRDLLTRVLHNGRSRSVREIAYRDFNV